MMKRMIQFLLNCTFSRYFDSEFLEGKKKNSAASCGDKFHTSLFQDRSLLQALASLLCAQGTKYRSMLQPVLLFAPTCGSVCSLCQGVSGGKTGKYERWEPKFLKAL